MRRTITRHMARGPRPFTQIWRATMIATFLLGAGALVPAGAVNTAGGLVAATAFANEAGDFCADYDLNPGVACQGVESLPSIIELEGWNTDGKGVGSCVSVNGHQGCSPEPLGSGYNESFCRSSCNGQTGHPYVENESPYNSVFTGWAYWR
jgi:hypothetical protein